MSACTYHFTSIGICPMCNTSTASARTLGMRLNRSQGLKPREKTGIAVSICKCSDCGLNFSQPMPVPNSILDHYGVPAEDYWKEEYFKVEEKYFAKQINNAKRLLNFEPGMKALDIGAGIGKAMVALKRAEFDTWGIEPSDSFRRKGLETFNLGDDRIVLSSIENAQFEDNFFDFVTFGAVLEHLHNPADSIEMALRWVRPGGVIQIEVPSSNHLMQTFLNAYFRFCGTNFVTNLSPMHPPYHLYSFTLKSFAVHGKRVGYSIPYHYMDCKAMVALKRAEFDTWGIEPSDSFRRKGLETFNLGDDRIVLSSIENAQFEDNFFDFVTFGAVLEHLHNPADSIEMALRWVRPGGVIQIEVPSSNHLMQTFLNAYFRFCGTNFVTNLSPMHPPYHLYSFTLKSFAAHGKRVDYSIPYHYMDVASIRHVPRIFHPLLRKWMELRDSGQQLTVWLQKPT